MPEDANDAWNSGFQNGISLLGARRANLDQDLRRQQLISEDRARRLQEAQTAQQMSMLLDQHNQQIQYRADMQKGIAKSILESSMPTPRDTVNDPGGESSDPSQGINMVPNTNSLQYINALAKNTLPIVAQYEPSKVQAYQSGLFTDALNLAKAQKEQEFQPGYRKVLNPDTGEYDTVFQGSLNSAQRIIQPGMRTITDQTTGETQEMIQTGPNSWRPKSDAEKRSTNLANLKSRLDQQKQRQKVIQESGIPDGLQETVDPDTGAVTTTERPGAYAEALSRKATALVPAERGKVQAQVLAGSKVADAAREMAGNLDDLNLGPVGTFQSIGEKIKAIANLPIGDRSATGTRAAVARFREGLASLGASQGLNAGTKQRLQLLMHDVPDPESFISGPPIVKIQLSNVLTQIANDMTENFAALQQPLPDQWKNPKDIIDAMDRGEIPAEKADKMLSGNIRVLAQGFKDAAQLGK